VRPCIPWKKSHHQTLGSNSFGKQPSGLTTDYLIKTRFSAVWSEQRAQFCSLWQRISPNG